MIKKMIILILIGMILISGCHMPARNVQTPQPLDETYERITSTLTANGSDEPSEISVNPQSSNEGREPTSNPGTIYLDPGLPESLNTINQENKYLEVENEADAGIRVFIDSYHHDEQNTSKSHWVYVLTASFYTITDNVSSEELSNFWRGDRNTINGFSKIYVTASTEAAINTILGTSDNTNVSIVTKEVIDNFPLDDTQSMIILPFEDLNQRMKVIRVDQQSPINDSFNPQNYSLTAAIWVETNLDETDIIIPKSNYDPNLRTVLIMTGVTAMTRATAHQMEIQGNQFPGQDIREWLTSADITHISNEVPFADNCPLPDPVQENLIFCSSPDRIELLEYVDADVIELSGNHLLDYGLEAINLTLNMYEERNWPTYAGGWNLEDSRSPALITHNGNQLAFIGCNLIGPPNDWASANRPGSAPCGNFQWMTNEIEQLKDDGYLPIVTLQYAEDYTSYPSSQMASDFQILADAGATVVNGSQAHTPKIMVFQGDSFLHYGLGNLFFDQMQVYYNDVYLPGTRDEFIDRLIFYDGKLISIELLTALLEDYARPRPMSSGEREIFLDRIFSTALDFIQ